MQPRNEINEIILGILLLAGMHIAGFILIFFLLFLLSIINSYIPHSIVNSLIGKYRFFYWLFSPGLTQLIYVIPLVLWLKRQQRWGLMKGVIISAVLTALLNGACWLSTGLPG